MTDVELSWLALHTLPGLGRKGLFRLIEAFGTPGATLAAAPARWRGQAGIRDTVAALPRDSAQLRETALLLDELGVRLVSYWDPDYPPLLRPLPDPPALLYLRGRLPGPESFAVVGARHASTTGRRFAADIARELAARQITIVSGLARGIDTAAHEGALAGDGPTVAVLGCGIDLVYPPENQRLHQRIVEQGGVISEYPPRTPPLPGHFPGRNRLISGLCRGVLVVEAATGSGSLITADFALEQGREVFAVPGALHAPTGAGVNRLLKDGARLVTEAGDILEVLWPGRPGGEVLRREESFLATLDGAAREVYRQLGEEPQFSDDLARKCGLTPPELSDILLDLELRGGVEQLPGGRYLRSRRP